VADRHGLSDFWDSRSRMADYFLQITGIEGESADSKHKGWLEVGSWSWGLTQRGSAHSGGGGGAGKGAHEFLTLARIALLER
jgi:type VI secretion system secreted protein Hcp